MAAETDTEKTDGLFIITEEVPAEAIEYARKNIAFFTNDCHNHLPLDTVTVGQPFVLKGHSCNLYYFLVYENGKFAASLRVYQNENGEYEGIYSPESGLNGLVDLMGVTTPDSPARLVVGKYDDIYAIVDGNILTVEEDPQGNITDVNFILQKINITYSLYESVVNAAEAIDFDHPSTQRAVPDGKYLPIRVLEQQDPDENWCTEYTVVAIIRYKLGLTDTKKVSAEKLMRDAYPNETSASLKQKTLSLNNAVRCGTSYGMFPTLSQYTMSYSRVQSEIVADRPIFFSTDNITTGKGSHAILCSGYSKFISDGKTYYYVWNPWYSTTDTMPTSTNIYTTKGGTKYKWTKTIYDWK